MQNITEKDNRPLRTFKVLADESEYKIKQIVVYPGQRLSLQKNQRRVEHWFVLSGMGIVTLDGHRLNKKRGESVEIPKCSVHRIENP